MVPPAVEMIGSYLFSEPNRLKTFMQWTVLRHLPMFVFGIVAYQIHAKWKDREQLNLNWGYALTFAGVFGYFGLIGGRWGSWMLDTYYWQGVFYSAVPLGLSLQPLRFFVNRMLGFFGKISYSVYLLHANVIAGLIPVYRNIYASIGYATPSFFVCLLLICTVTTLVSWLAYKFVEQPGIRLGSRWVARIVERRGQALGEVEKTGVALWFRRPWVP